MTLLFTPEHLEEEKKVDSIITTLSHEILSGDYDNVIINCGNFLLWEKNGEIVPLIPELYEDDSWNVVDKQKHDICFQEWTLYNTRFSLKSLEMWLNVLLDVKASPLAKDMTILPLLSVDDKYVDKNNALKYLHQWYKAVPWRYRDILQTTFDGSNNTKKILKIMTSIFKNSWQNITNDFILSENELVWRFFTIRKEHIAWAKEEYKEYQESLPDKTRKCSLELFHLLKTLVNEKDVIDQWSHSRLCIIQFIPDACEWSAIASAKWIIKNRDDIDVISIVPIMTGANMFVITKFNKDGVILIEHAWVKKETMVFPSSPGFDEKDKKEQLANLEKLLKEDKK